MFCFLLTFLLKLFLYLLLVLIVLLIGLKIWLEPIKGVCKCKTKLHGRTALVTGGNSGIGLETARDLARRGARVVIACRDEKKTRLVIDEVVASTGNDNVEFMYLDLSSFANIRRFAAEFNTKEERLDILVNNAGCAGLKRHLSEDGIELVMQVNYLGPFLLTNLLLEKLKQCAPSRIVIVSSYGHFFHKFDPEDLRGLNTSGYWTKYANSKLCNVLWAKALAKHLPKNVTANSLHPGVVKTDIFKRLPKTLKNMVLGVISLIFKDANEGAQTTVHLCVAPELEHATGGYYSDCRPARAARLVSNNVIVEKIWRESLRLTQSR